MNSHLRFLFLGLLVQLIPLIVSLTFFPTFPLGTPDFHFLNFKYYFNERLIPRVPSFSNAYWFAKGCHSLTQNILFFHESIAVWIGVTFAISNTVEAAGYFSLFHLWFKWLSPHFCGSLKVVLILDKVQQICYFHSKFQLLTNYWG